MATTELLQLIDLSLGGEPPCGVVNFNNMHTLLHEIVRRLLQLEGFVISNSTPIPMAEGGATYVYPPQGGSVAEPVVMMSKSTSVSPAKRSSIAVSTSKQGDVSASKQVDNRSIQIAADGGGKPSTSPSTTPADTAGASIAEDTPQEDQVKSGIKQKIVTDEADSRDAVIAKGEADKGEENVQPVTTADAAVAKKPSSTDVAVATSKEITDGEETKIMQELGTQLSGDIAAIAGQTSPVGTSVSHMSMRHPSTASSVGAYHVPFSRSRPHVITASNDLAAMERKITELENRLGTVEALPDLLERKGANAMATPVKDLWNFTSLTKRVDAAEDGIHKVK